MRIRKVVIGGVLVVIGMPMGLVLIAAASIRLLDRSSGSIASSGRERHCLLYVPPSYDPLKPTPLVIDMHAAMWPANK